ncbi:MAG: hypothetical protein LQ340_003787, partial [Diploschistes diacapsis]
MAAIKDGMQPLPSRFPAPFPSQKPRDKQRKETTRLTKNPPLLFANRLAATTNIPQDQGHDILVRQRRNRPVSPHLGIYRPQITWLASAFNRLTGSVLSGAFYIFGFGYLVQPLLGVHIFESSSLIAGFAAMPLWAKVPVKFTLSLFFTFHGFNG